MNIRIVCYEDPHTWICGKIARRLNECLNELGHHSTLADTIDEGADINHHVIYLNYAGAATGIHSLMVTHIDEALKLRKLENALKTARVAICMSAESTRQLGALGLPVDRLAYVNPAYDGAAKPRRFVIGVTTRLYPDGRKQEANLVKLCERISPEDFAFRIMGFGWAEIVATLRDRGFQIEYAEEFNQPAYLQLMSELDYYLYLSGDEGSMGYIDALAAGVKTIVQPQGFHRDAPNGITHPFTAFGELEEIFQSIAADKRARQAAVKEWSWTNYARNHVAIWEACLAGRPFAEPVPAGGEASNSTLALRGRLWMNAFLWRTRTLLNIGKNFHCDSRLWQKRYSKSRRGK